MPKARIIRPSKNAMQSGRANTTQWKLSFIPENARFIDPLMGWTGSSDMMQEITLTFDSQEEAESYADKYGIEYDLTEPHERKVTPKNYSDNFSYSRVKVFSLPKNKNAPSA